MEKELDENNIVTEFSSETYNLENGDEISKSVTSSQNEELIENSTKRGFQTIDLAYMGMFVALMAVCSWVSIPTTVPFTLQTLAIFTCVAILGLKRGLLSVIAYIILGAVGVPVFAGFSGGPGVLFGSTGGYIIGFIFTALIVGGMMELLGKKLWVMIVSMLLGLVACYAFGTIWFIIVFNQSNDAIGIGTALTWCVIPFIIPDCLKIALAIGIQKSVGKYVK